MVTTGERLQLLYDVARSVSTFSDLDGVLRYATQRTRELLQAECCSVLLLDDTGTRLYFPVASQAASGRPAPAEPEDLIFSSDRGIAGWVVRHGEAVAVADVSTDPRFYGAVDQATGRATQALLCAPLRTRAGIIGVVEVMNPLRGGFAAEDVPFLEAIAADLAVACENARLYDGLRRESVSLRQVCAITGAGLCVFGLVCGFAGLYAHLGAALPLGEALGRWSTITALVLVLLGGALGAVSRGWIVPPTETRRPPEFYAARSAAT